jgi:hypothetical protein
MTTRHFALAGLALTLVLFSVAPASAAHVFVGVAAGYPGIYNYPPYGYGYYGHPVYYYPGAYYYPSYYVASSPTVVYQPAPQVTYVAPSSSSSVSASQTSETYTDDQGRTCREYRSSSTINGQVQSTYGTACLQPDGSWRVVP